MDELQRAQYLEEMGIQVFVPRFVLPAAKPSAQAKLPQVELGLSPANQSPANLSVVNTSIEQSLEALADTPKAIASVTGIVTNIIGELGGNVKKILQPKETDSENVSTIIEERETLKAGVVAQEPVSFSLSLWRVNSSLMVIDTRHPKQALPTTTLLSNILFAKGVTQRLPAPEVITWPMFEHIQNRGGWQEAADMVSAFLSARLSALPVQYIWLMGADAYKAVVNKPAQDFSSQVGLALDLSDLSALALVLPSLTDMLLLPELKKQTWNAIKPYGIK